LLHVDRTGIIEYDAKVASDDAMLDAAIEAGADDVSSSGEWPRVYASRRPSRSGKALEGQIGEARKAALTWKPQNHRAGGRRDRREAVEADRPVERARRTSGVFANSRFRTRLVARMGG